jgi:hypothetical protein
MAYQTVRPLTQHQVDVFNPVAGTPTGSRISVPSPYRGRVIEAGFVPASLVASAITMALAIGNNGIDSTTSNFTQVITSTLGTFSSTVLPEGKVASVSPPSPAYVNVGDALQFTTSGGNTSAIGAVMYAIIDSD